MLKNQDEFYINLTEKRLELSLTRMSGADNRAIGLLGLTAVVLVGIWSVQYLAPISPAGWLWHVREPVATGLLGLAVVLAGVSLLHSPQYDAPNMREFYRYHRFPDESRDAYFDIVMEAIEMNTEVAEHKGRFILASALSLFLGILVILI